jgi:ABC-2 type transport system ATP-binding protein
MADHPAIMAAGLRKHYGDQHALDGFDLHVPPGTICGLLGPNGAGKTTVVRILTTLVRADGGRAEVAGIDVAAHPDQVRARIGLSGQEPAVDEILTARQNLVLFGRLNGLRTRAAARRADELLEQFDLAATGTKAVKRFSGGMRRRLDLATTLILAPAVLFLDEPTTGLDPRNRNEVWAAIRALVAGGTTVLLTTQYLEEADRLADQIVVLESGRAIATGTPDSLKRRVGGDQLEIEVGASGDLAAAAAVLGRLATVAADVDPEARLVSAPIPATAVTAALQALAEAGVPVVDLTIRRPTLDDVFLRLTGHRAASDAPTEVPA